MAAMTSEQIDHLRLILGESIPDGGAEGDTLFTNDQMQVFWDLGAEDYERAAFEGWKAKAAQFANLVDVVDGAASRAMSDLLKNAQNMVKTYQRNSSGPTEGRTRIGRIVRA